MLVSAHYVSNYYNHDLHIKSWQEIQFEGKPFLLDPSKKLVYKEVQGGGGAMPEQAGKWVKVRSCTCRCECILHVKSRLMYIPLRGDSVNQSHVWSLGNFTPVPISSSIVPVYIRLFTHSVPFHA